MRISRKKCAAILLTAALVGTHTVVSMAASKNKITTIRVECDDNITRGGAIDADEVEFTSSADNYAITEWQFDNEDLSWKDGDTPKVTVRFETSDSFYFSVVKDKITVKGDPATVVSTKKENSQTLLITFALTPISKRVAPVDYAYLKDRIATWAPADGALSYELFLIRDSKPVGSKKVTTATSYDFGTAMLKEGEYYYRVRGVGAEGSIPGILLDSESIYLRPGEKNQTQQKLNNSEIATGSWQADGNGYWWKRLDGTWPANSWELINSKWYFFNEGGYRVSGWVCWNNLWYYLGPDGDMWVNTITPDGAVVNGDGVKIS